jgi:hypothetical protein
MDHEWIEVGNRRWCITCAAFQSRSKPGDSWRPMVKLHCDHDAPYANRPTILAKEQGNG